MKTDKYYEVFMVTKSGSHIPSVVYSEEDAALEFKRFQSVLTHFKAGHVEVHLITRKDITQDFEEVLNNDRR